MKEISIGGIKAIESIKIRDNKSGKTELTTEVLRTLITTAIWLIWKNRNERVFKGRKETKDQQIETWRAELTREVEMEYESILQANIRKKDEMTRRFQMKWSNDINLVRVEVNKKGKR